MIRTSVIALLLFAGVSKAADHHQTCTPEEVRELVKNWSGRWLSDSTLMQDDEALGKKAGEKFKQYVTRTPVLDGMGFITKIAGGSGSAIDLAVYNKTTKQLKVMGGGTLGGSFEAVLWKAGPTTWKGAATGVTPEGLKAKYKATFKFNKKWDELTLELEIGTDEETRTITSKSIKLSK